MISARVALPKKMNAEDLPFGALGSFFFLAFLAGFLGSSSRSRFFFFFFFSGDGLLAFFCEGASRSKVSWLSRGRVAGVAAARHDSLPPLRGRRRRRAADAA